MAPDGSPTRRRVLAAGGAAAAEVAAGLLGGLTRSPALADPALDIQILQTAASLENAALAVYDALVGLPFVAGPTGGPTLTAFLNETRAHHADHARAWNDAVARLGGTAQQGANAWATDGLARERGRLTDTARVLEFAIQFETVATQTFQNAVGLLGDATARKLAAAVAGVEAQHTAALRLVRLLVAGRSVNLFSLASGTVTRLPAEAGDAGFPDAFSQLDQARPPTEGAPR
jgi:hypothetical protein